jgi:hypothetical protein
MAQTGSVAGVQAHDQGNARQQECRETDRDHHDRQPPYLRRQVAEILGEVSKVFAGGD